MIETPGAALSADALALEADFFAIGTNDLTACTLAVDHGESDVASMAGNSRKARLIEINAPQVPSANVAASPGATGNQQ
jgi:phosphoenolpyruvate-protein kinase (PTS system EI component)